MVAELPMPDRGPLATCMAGWHQVLAGDRSALDRIVADDAVFHSPVVYRPQRGKELVVMYLTGASMSFGGDGPGGTDGDGPRSFAHPAGGEWDGRFRYVRAVYGERDAVLEFETTMGGTYVDGVDMITCDDAGLITDFKVMIRPLRAIDAVRERMMAALERLQGASGPA